jgi:hypothetical protein
MESGAGFNTLFTSRLFKLVLLVVGIISGHDGHDKDISYKGYK